MDINGLDPNEIFDLLEICDELCFSELIDDLQLVLIIKGNQWIQDLSLQCFVEKTIIVYYYCGELICENPVLFFKSDDDYDNVTTVNESILYRYWKEMICTWKKFIFGITSLDGELG